MAAEDAVEQLAGVGLAARGQLRARELHADLRIVGLELERRAVFFDRAIRASVLPSHPRFSMIGVPAAPL